MKKRVIVTLTTSIIVVLAIGTMLIVSAQSSYRTMEKKATNLALQQGLVNGVTNAYVYNGSLAYITVLGIEEENERKAVFVPANFKKKAIQEVWLADGISKSEAIMQLQEQAKVKSVLHTKLGYEEPVAVWEITYIDNKDDLNYMYYEQKNGEEWKHITVTKENDDL